MGMISKLPSTIYLYFTIKIDQVFVYFYVCFLFNEELIYVHTTCTVFRS